MQRPGGTRYHQAPSEIAPSRRRIRGCCPGDAEGVAQPQEGERGLGEDRDRYDEDGVGEDQGEDVGEDVTGDDLAVAGAEGAGALDVGAFLECQHLGAHHPRRPGPGDDPDDERDDEEAAAQDGGEHYR